MSINVPFHRWSVPRPACSTSPEATHHPASRCPPRRCTHVPSPSAVTHYHGFQHAFPAFVCFFVSWQHLLSRCRDLLLTPVKMRFWDEAIKVATHWCTFGLINVLTPITCVQATQGQKANPFTLMLDPRYGCTLNLRHPQPSPSLVVRAQTAAGRGRAQAPAILWPSVQRSAQPAVGAPSGPP